MRKILLVDDHTIIRSAMKLVIHGLLPDAEIHEAYEVETVMSEIKKNNFDLVILDMNLGEYHFYELLRGIMRINFSTRVLVFTINNPVIFARHALRQGASGFLNKNASETEIREAIQTVLAGKTFLPTECGDESLNPFKKLSDKEFEILILLARGKGPAYIASILGITATTVTTYQRRIFDKLNIDNKTKLAELALKYNL